MAQNACWGCANLGDAKILPTESHLVNVMNGEEHTHLKAALVWYELAKRSLCQSYTAYVTRSMRGESYTRKAASRSPTARSRRRITTHAHGGGKVPSSGPLANHSTTPHRSSNTSGYTHAGSWRPRRTTQNVSSVFVWGDVRADPGVRVCLRYPTKQIQATSRGGNL